MRAIICGGRDLDPFKVRDFLLSWEEAGNISLVIEGGASGADLGGRLFAQSKDIPYETFNANWKKYGRLAGHKRNQKMLDEGRPDMVVIFPGGKGTNDMTGRAIEYLPKLKIWYIFKCE